MWNQPLWTCAAEMWCLSGEVATILPVRVCGTSLSQHLPFPFAVNALYSLSHILFQMERFSNGIFKTRFNIQKKAAIRSSGFGAILCFCCLLLSLSMCPPNTCNSSCISLCPPLCYLLSSPPTYSISTHTLYRPVVPG